MKVDIDAEKTSTKQHVEIEIGPVWIRAQWPRIANRKIIEKIETVEKATQQLREEIEK